jgi:hypothetical protein
MAVQGDGSVKLIANTHTEGTIPRSLTIDPTGKFLYSLNQSATMSPPSGWRRWRARNSPANSWLSAARL